MAAHLLYLGVTQPTTNEEGRIDLLEVTLSMERQDETLTASQSIALRNSPYFGLALSEVIATLEAEIEESE